MAESAYTKGPWFAKGRYIGTENHMSFIGECRDVNGNWTDQAPASANARLIAAAPDLVEAAKCLPTHWLDSGVLTDKRSDGLRIEMRIVGTTYEAEMTVSELRAAAAALSRALGKEG